MKSLRDIDFLAARWYVMSEVVETGFLPEEMLGQESQLKMPSCVGG